ncbi:uracil phosphoribosyltransferase [Shigella flexneri]
MALIVDRMLATGGSVIATIDLLKQAAAALKSWCRLQRRKVSRRWKVHPDVELYTASIDQGLNQHGYIIPGLAMPAIRFLVPSKRISAKQADFKSRLFFE